ncbi:hypothetical protein [Nonomuraea sp. SYSU D8015]|nr:hypothetical protein [Nonomuraea sp. SYSU D8015]
MSPALNILDRCRCAIDLLATELIAKESFINDVDRGVFVVPPV